jgi:nicotinate-nucleotide adenylyltransferase
MPKASPSQHLRLGLFGGTFDPVHVGHLLIAWEAQRQMRLDQVIFIPCRQSPHKNARTFATGRQRYAMLKASLKEHAWARVSDHEITKTTPSYSIDTVDYFQNLNPEAGLFWILGSDQWATLPKWHRADELRKKALFIVFPRPDRPKPMRHWIKHDLKVRIDVSATQVRALCARGHCPSWLLPDAAFRSIKKYRLYRTS